MLDRNRIKIIDDQAFASQWNLQELHIEENRIKDLGGLMHLENLQRLYLGMNRIQVRLLGLHSITLQCLKYPKSRTAEWNLMLSDMSCITTFTLMPNAGGMMQLCLFLT